MRALSAWESAEAAPTRYTARYAKRRVACAAARDRERIAALPENSAELSAAHFNLRNIRIALARPEFRPR